MKFILLTITLIMLGCDYHHDKLLIKNSTTRDICFETLIRTNSGKYIQVSAGDKIYSNSFVNPITRISIATELESKSFDKILYLVFYDCIQSDYVNHHIDSLVGHKQFLIKKYTSEQLDDSDWIITYSGK